MACTSTLPCPGRGSSGGGWGYNASVTGRLRADAGHPDGHRDAPRVGTVELHKPRRPASGRFTSNNLVGSAPSSEGHLFDIAVELTAPARATLAHLGRPTDRLLMARSSHPKGSGLFIERFEDEPTVSSAGARWNARAGLHDDAGDAMSVSLRRLRLTEQVLNGQPARTPSRPATASTACTSRPCMKPRRRRSSGERPTPWPTPP